MKSESSPEFRALLKLLLGVAAIYLFSIGTHPPIPSMEPRFAEVIREMVESGRYLVPIKNGLPYIEYPVLYYWIALAGRLAGLPEVVAIRVPTFLSYLLWIAALWRFQRLFAPHWPALLLPLTAAALPGLAFQFYIAQTDGMLILGSLVAFTGFARWRLRSGPGAFPWELWLGVTLATAAKGPVGMMVTLPAMGLEIAAAALVEHRGQWLRRTIAEAWRMGWLRGLLLVLAVNAPWYIAAGLREGWEFCRAILVYQNFTRFTVGFDHLKPWWYYGTTIWYDLFPLALLLPFGLWQAWKNREEFLPRMAAVWVIWTVLFFSLSASKQGKYIFTAAPAFALLALYALDCMLDATRRERIHRLLQRFAAGVLLVFGIGVVVALPLFGDRVGGVEGLKQIRAEVQARPGQLFTYQWPRSQMLYELGHPLPYFRSARDLYEAIRSGAMRPGDYLLVGPGAIPPPDQTPRAAQLSPAPAAPFFEPVMTVKSSGELALYRLLPSAPSAGTPGTPEPPPVKWWERFDTD